MNIKFVTLTGVDEQTDIEALDDLCQEYPVAEFAILYSPTKKNARFKHVEQTRRSLGKTRTSRMRAVYEPINEMVGSK